MKKVKVSNIKSRLGFYRIHKNNASRNHIKQLKAALFVKKKTIKYLLENKLFNFIDLLEITLFYYVYFFYVHIKNLSYKLIRN